jgi:hypothetical protein
MIEEKIRHLVERSAPLTTNSDLPRNGQHKSEYDGWITEALNIIEVAVPKPNNAYRRSIDKLVERGFLIQNVRSIGQILSALLQDIDAGLLGDLGNQIRAETFDDFLDHAEFYQKEGRKQEAGVIAGVVFEDTVRQICRDKCGITDKDQKLEDLINTLKGRGVITGQQSKQAKVGSHVRTKATHAQWDEFDLEGVAATIQITKIFLREHLGG